MPRYDAQRGHRRCRIPFNPHVARNAQPLRGVNRLAWPVVVNRALTIRLRPPGRTCSQPVVGGLSGDQRFFVAYARRQRWVGRDEDLRTGLLSSSHSPHMYRVNGTLTNFSPFYDAWSVRAGDRMYRPINQRVRIW